MSCKCNKVLEIVVVLTACIYISTVHAFPLDQRCFTISNYFVSIYRGSGFYGKGTSFYPHKNECVNFKDYGMENLVGSFDVYTYCMRVFVGRDCRGRSYTMEPEDDCQKDLASCGLYQMKSTIMC